jgi:hypothetical protein
MEPLKYHLLNYISTDENADIEVVEYLYNKNAAFDTSYMNLIASSGSLNILRFFMSKGISINQHIIGNLATRGQFSMIKGLYNNIVPVISLTGQIGNQTVTRFFNKNKKELDYNTVIKGIKYGCFEIKQEFTVSKQLLLNINMLTNEYNFEPTKINCVVYNQLPPLDEGTIQTTARHRYIDLLKFLIKVKAPIDEDAMYDAIVRGFDDVVLMLYEYYPVINNYHIQLAKLWNRNKILNFLRDKPIINTTTIHQDYDISEFQYYNKSVCEILYRACSHGEIDILKIYRGSINIKILSIDDNLNTRNGYKHDHNDMLYVAILNGQFEIVKYIENNYIFTKDSKYISCATRIGRMDMLEYLIKNDYIVCEKAMVNAIIKGRLDFVEYLCNNGAPIPNNALLLAKKDNFNEIYEFLKNKTV